MLRTLRTTSFRFTLIYGLMFSAAVALLGAWGYRVIFSSASAEIERIIDEEIVLLAEVYAQQTPGDFRGVIRQRAAWRDNSIYMLIGAPTGVRLEGDLTSLPEEALASGNALFEFSYDGRLLDADDPESEAAKRKAVAKLAQFRPAENADPAFIILVGRDITDQESLRDSLSRAVVRIALATVVLGLVLGLVFSSSLMRKVDAMNKTARAIRAGDLSQRIPLTGAGDEMEQLAQNLNDMLDQIERLMTGMKEVSDNIAHDLRSPLTRIRNRLTTAMESEGEQQREDLQVTLTEAERIIATFNELLSIARIESGEVTGEKEPINIAEIANEMVELYEPAIAEAGFGLNLETKTVPQIRGSRALISQAIANLLDNAMKYGVSSDNGGQDLIEVRVRATKRGRVLLSVADNGPGVPEDKHSHIIQRYSRLEKSRTTPGNGLGLSLVAAIARAHEADLKLAPTQPENANPGLKIMIRFRPID